MEKFATKFLDIFQGRPDAYGGDEGRAIYGTVDETLMGRHLTGMLPIGIYNVRHQSDTVCGWDDDRLRNNLWVRWGCCDIDTGDWTEAYRLATALEAMGLRPWMERSRSKGWHIWIFADRWVQAWVMRRCLKVAYKAIGLAAKEANPKSEILQPNQLGNYVRLPYNGAANPGRQTMMTGWNSTDDGTVLPLETFLENVVPDDRNLIRKWADLWFEPPRKIIVVDAVTAVQTQQIVNLLPKGLRTLFDVGPSNGDTSQGLMALAHNMAQSGAFKPGDVYSVVVAADARWGKYAVTRHDPEIYFQDLVRRAFQ